MFFRKNETNIKRNEKINMETEEHLRENEQGLPPEPLPPDKADIVAMVIAVFELCLSVIIVVVAGLALMIWWFVK